MSEKVSSASEPPECPDRTHPKKRADLRYRDIALMGLATDRVYSDNLLQNVRCEFSSPFHDALVG
jgi:hypothetical protein